jgi:hypothetical protein
MYHTGVGLTFRINVIAPGRSGFVYGNLDQSQQFVAQS